MTTSIVLGLGGCLDSELVLEPGRLQEIVDAQRISLAEVGQPEHLGTERDVLLSVLAYLREGIGGERYVESADALLALQGRFAHQITLGGTNVRAGRTLAMLGHPNVLHVPGRDRTFEGLLVEGSRVPCETPSAEYVPHLIVQFPAGLRVGLVDGEIVAPHANRVILVHDPVSELTPLHEDLADWLRPGGVLVVSGLNSIRDETILGQRLATLGDVLEGAPEGLRVLYEDADYHVPRFRRRVWELLASRADVVSMNEDELASLTGRRVDVTDPQQIADALGAVLELLPGGSLVVHSKHWALAAGPRAQDLPAALEQGIAAAGARFLAGDEARSDTLDLVRRQPVSTHGQDIAERLDAHLGVPATVRPARVLSTQTPTTIGLGDTFLGGLIAGIVDTGAFLPATTSALSHLEAS